MHGLFECLIFVSESFKLTISSWEPNSGQLYCGKSWFDFWTSGLQHRDEEGRKRRNSYYPQLGTVFGSAGLLDPAWRSQQADGSSSGRIWVRVSSWSPALFLSRRPWWAFLWCWKMWEMVRQRYCRFYQSGPRFHSWKVLLLFLIFPSFLLNLWLKEDHVHRNNERNNASLVHYLKKTNLD